MQEQCMLHLVGGDVLAAPADRVLDPVREANPTIAVHDDLIAGMEPEVAPCLDGLLRHLEVAGGEGERCIVAEHQLAGLAPWHLLIVLIDRACLKPGPYLAHPARTL